MWSLYPLSDLPRAPGQLLNPDVVTINLLEQGLQLQQCFKNQELEGRGN